MAAALSFEARGALRYAVEQNEGVFMGDTAVRDELYRAGYIVRASRANPNHYEATSAGIEAAQRIVQDSGDGPEALKALFALPMRTR